VTKSSPSDGKMPLEEAAHQGAAAGEDRDQVQQVAADGQWSP
jgi:hypothetical protein